MARALIERGRFFTRRYSPFALRQSMQGSPSPVVEDAKGRVNSAEGTA